MAILKPAPGLPRRYFDGTRTLSKPASAVLLPRIPILCAGGVLETPSQSASTRKQLILLTGLLSPGISVRAKTVRTWEMPPLVIHCFRPLRTQTSSFSS